LRDFIQEIPLNDPNIAKSLKQIIQELVRQEVRKLGFNKKYPAVITAVNGNTASVKLYNGNVEISNVKIRNNVIAQVGDECYVEAINGDLNNIYIDFVKSMRGTELQPGTGDMLKAVYDIDNDGKVECADVADSVPWDGITNKPTTLSGYGITDGIQNLGSTPSIQAGNDSLKPSAGTIGRLYIATDTNKIYRDNGTSWVVVGAVNWDDILNKPSTLSGYGITDAVNIADVVTTATANKILKLDSNAKLPASITGNADGNAATATKLQMARIIQLSGDVAGSASFDGSADINISATIVDDSHNHSNSSIINVDWSKLLNKPSSSVTDIDDAVNKRHNQNTDTMLTGSGVNIINTTGTGNIVDFKVNNVIRASIDNTGKFTGTVDWGNINNKPSTYTPSSHSHTISEITNLQTSLDTKANISDVLTKTNTTPFTPTDLYHPATKKYVDDSVANAGGGDMLKAIYDTDNDGIVDNAENADKIKGKNIFISTTQPSNPQIGDIWIDIS